MVQRFDGKVAIVTGGGGGIGAAICRRLSSEGARVVIADIDEAAAQCVADTLDNSMIVKVVAVPKLTVSPTSCNCR